MLTRNERPAARRRNAATAAKPGPARKPAQRAPRLGELPEWDLSDLYPNLDSPKVKDDLARSDAMCIAFEERYNGKLDTLAKGPQGGAALAAAVREFEAIDDLLGRITSYALLVY